jgi:hypothetical protein
MRRAVAWLCAALTLTGAAAALAQAPAPVLFDPAIARQGTALVLGADGPALTRDGAAATSLAIVLPRGMRVDRASRRKLCSAKQAAVGACPAESRIGFGRYVVTVAGFLPTGGSDLSWWIDAFLGRPARRGDAASVVLRASLLGADSVKQLLAPALGTAVAPVTTTRARIVRRSGRAQIRLAQLPARVQVAAPGTAAPSRLELTLSAVRRTRKDFVRRYRIPDGTGGYRIQRVPDHRLVGHDLFRAPRSCGGSWSYELRVAFAGATRRTVGKVPCAQAISGVPSAARRRAGSSRR